MPKKTKRQKLRASRQKIKKIFRVLKYIPALAIFIMAGLMNFTPLLGPKTQAQRVLGYTTSISINDLLDSTNDERGSRGIDRLKLNSTLNSAAKAKAKDMVKRDYWSHNTPDGNEPWVFFNDAGYSYRAAGENLAYGFATSRDTVTGWMESKPHKENLLNDIFTEVGFGVANSADYVGTGEQTIVVAMYGTPQVAAAATEPEYAAAAEAQTRKDETAQVATKPKPLEVKTVEPVAVNKQPVSKRPGKRAVDIVQATATPANIRRIQILTGGNVAWSTALLVTAILGMGILWLMQRGLHLRRLLLNAERYATRHLHLDLTVVALIVLGATLLQTAGIVR